MTANPGDDLNSPLAFLVEPIQAIVDCVAAVEPHLAVSAIERTVSQIADTRAKQRRLAQALHDAPDLLYSGRPEGPKLIGVLVRALREVGATRVTPPLCARCQRPQVLRALDIEGRRVCTPCAAAARLTRQPCAACGRVVRVVQAASSRARPLCSPCLKSEQKVDHLPRLIHHVAGLRTGLNPRVVRQILESSLPAGFEQRAASLELDAHPELLTTNAALGSHRLVVLAEKLIERGAVNIAIPQCPLCGARRRIRWGRDGIRCCRSCYESTRRVPCTRCLIPTSVATRTLAGEPLCVACYRADPVNFEQCSKCRRSVFIVRREDSGELYCTKCWRGHEATCVDCGKLKPCHFAGTEKSRCEHCSRLTRSTPCSRCGETRPVWSRTADGAALCTVCSQKREPCGVCGTNALVATRTEDGPLCKMCYRKDPISFRTCVNCGSFERAYHFDLCTACAADQQLRSLLGDKDGTIPSAVQPLYETMAASSPPNLIVWIRDSPAVPALRKLLSDDTPITHASLDAFLPNRAVQLIRSALVANNVLEPRDEYLATLERWLHSYFQGIEHPADRKLVRSFAIWQRLHRLRRKATTKPLSPNQITQVRSELTSIAKLLNWLRRRGLNLTTCNQADIDEFLAASPPSMAMVSVFVRWAARHGSPNVLTIRSRQSTGTTPIEQDVRWALTKILLHNDSIALADRFAGLLVLLFGQTASRIVTLTIDDLEQAGDTVTLRLGQKPVELPAPLDTMALQLASTRRNFVQLARVDDQPWLYPGAHPGKHLTHHRLSVRLNRIGVRIKPNRIATMIDLAAQLPATVVSQLLGVHINTATKWSARAASSNARYAAALTRQ